MVAEPAPAAVVAELAAAGPAAVSAEPLEAPVSLPPLRPIVVGRSYTTLLSARPAEAPALDLRPAHPSPEIRSNTYNLTRHYQKCHDLAVVKVDMPIADAKQAVASSLEHRLETDLPRAGALLPARVPIPQLDPERVVLVKRWRLRQEARHDQALNLLNLVKRSSRALTFTRAGNSFRSVLDDDDQRLYADAVHRAMALDLDQVLAVQGQQRTRKRNATLMRAVSNSVVHRPLTIGPGGTEPLAGPDRPARSAEPSIPLILNVDAIPLSDDPFYDFLLQHLPKSARLYARGSSKQGTSSSPKHRRLQSSLNKRRNSRQHFLELVHMTDERPEPDADGAAGAVRSPAPHPERTSLPAPSCDQQSLRTSCSKFDQLRVRLSRRLAQRLREFESERSAANRAKFQVADHSLSYRSASRDLGEMRARAAADQLALGDLRRDLFRKLDQVVQQVRGPDPAGGGRRELAPNEAAILQAIAGYLQSPYGVDMNHHSLVHLLEDVSHEALSDPAALKILHEFIGKVGISENDLRAALAASHHEFPATMFDIANIVKSSAATTIMGGLRSAGLAGRLLRKRKDVRMTSHAIDG